MGKSDIEVANDSAEETATEAVDPPGRSSSVPPRRINVAVTPDMMAAIDKVIDREGVTLTEAVRRLIGYGDVVYNSIRIEGQKMFFRDPDGSTREIILL